MSRTRDDKQNSKMNTFAVPTYETLLAIEPLLLNQHKTKCVTNVAIGPKLQNRKHIHCLVASTFDDNFFVISHVPIASNDEGDTISVPTNFSLDLRHYRSPRLKGKVRALKFSSVEANGRHATLAVADSLGYIYFCNEIISGGLAHIRAHSSSIQSLDFGGKGCTFLLSSSNDKTAKIWSLPDKKFRTSFVGHQNWLRSAKLSPDSTRVATCSDDGSVRIWSFDKEGGPDIKSHCVLILKDKCAHYPILEVCFNPHGDVLASLTSRDVLIWELRNATTLQKFSLECPHFSISFHTSGSFLTAFRKDGLRYFDVFEGWLFPKRDNKTENWYSAASGFNDDGRLFVTGDNNGFVKLWTCM